MNAEVLAEPTPSLFIDGFEQFKDSVNFVGEKGDPLMNAMGRANYQFRFRTDNNGNRLGSVGQVAGRTSNMALTLSDMSVCRSVTWTGRYFSSGCAISFFNRNAVMTLMVPNTNQMIACAWLNPMTGIPFLNGVMGGSAPTKKVWYYFEIVLDRQSQTMSLIINNRMEVPNVPLPVEALTVDSLVVQWGTYTAAKFEGMEDLPLIGGMTYYDDVYARDGDRFGSLAIATRFPTSQGAVTWVPAPIENANWQSVSLIPPQPLDVHVSSETMGAADHYLSNKPLVNDNMIVVTGICVMVRKSPILSARLGVFIGNDVAAVRRDGLIETTHLWRTYYQTFSQVVSDTRGGIEAAPFGILVAPP